MSERIFSLLAFRKGARIVNYGSNSTDCFYVIHSGNVRLSCDIEIVGGRNTVILGPGNFFSVESGLTGRTNLESAVAESDAAIISVRRNKFVDFIREYQKNALKIIQYLSARMRFLDNLLTGRKNSVVQKSPGHLYDIAEYYNLQKQYKAAYYVYNRFLEQIPDGEKAEHAKQMIKKLEKYAEGVRFKFSKKNIYRFYPKGAMLFAEGECGNELFVIREGVVRITKITDSQEKEISILQTGDIMGEMSLIEGLPRSTSAIAIEDCDVLAVEQDDFPQLIKSDPAVAMRIGTALSDRIWITHSKIINSGLTKTPLLETET
ncbi:MAG: hypothetical protein Ta2F_02670 [Termitinemataceae bacterium]|nr:MAG: hypothetical protein Ta2F_02670 [Termitinemataceae bacterium]